MESHFWIVFIAHAPLYNMLCLLPRRRSAAAAPGVRLRARRWRAARVLKSSILSQGEGAPQVPALALLVPKDALEVRRARRACGLRGVAAAFCVLGVL